MALKTTVKVSAVNNLSDARYCAGMGVTLMGFVLDKTHPRYINATTFGKITGWISNVTFVGELDNFDSKTIAHVLSCHMLHYIQLNYTDNLKQYIAHIDTPIILKLVLQETTSFTQLQAIMRQYVSYVHYFLLEAISTPTQSNTQWQAYITRLAKEFPIIQGFNISVDNLNYLLERTGIQGIGLQGGEEIKPGYKNFDGLAEILETLEVD